MRNLLRIAALLALAAIPAMAQTPAPRPAAAAPIAPTAPAKPVVPPPSASPPAAPATATRPAAAATSAAKIDINSATAQQLDALPEIGPVRSKAIVAGRPYEELADLVKKKVLSQGVFDRASPRMALANINTSSAKDMEKTLPGIGDVRSKAIVAGRPYATPQDLVTKGIITQAVFDKMKDVAAW